MNSALCHCETPSCLFIIFVSFYFFLKFLRTFKPSASNAGVGQNCAVPTQPQLSHTEQYSALSNIAVLFQRLERLQIFGSVRT